jgi:site-specific DNA-methyltransferase (adenine-specific)
MQSDASWHDCPKHLQSWEIILDKFIEKPAKILDIFLGSGTTAIACHNLGFELTACELDVDYYNKAIERIKNHISQIKLEL